MSTAENHTSTWTHPRTGEDISNHRAGRVAFRDEVAAILEQHTTALD